jgi:hypothetical protein
MSIRDGHACMNGSVPYTRATYFLDDDLGKKNDWSVPFFGGVDSLLFLLGDTGILLANSTLLFNGDDDSVVVDANRFLGDTGILLANSTLLFNGDDDSVVVDANRFLGDTGILLANSTLLFNGDDDSVVVDANRFLGDTGILLANSTLLFNGDDDSVLVDADRCSGETRISLAPISPSDFFGESFFLATPKKDLTVFICGNAKIESLDRNLVLDISGVTACHANMSGPVLAAASTSC